MATVSCNDLLGLVPSQFLSKFLRRIHLGSLPPPNFYLTLEMPPQIFHPFSLLTPLRRSLSRFHQGNLTSSLQMLGTPFLDHHNLIHFRSPLRTPSLTTRFRPALRSPLISQPRATPAVMIIGPWRWLRTIGSRTRRNRKSGEPGRNDVQRPAQSRWVRSPHFQTVHP